MDGRLQARLPSSPAEGGRSGIWPPTSLAIWPGPSPSSTEVTSRG